MTDEEIIASLRSQQARLRVTPTELADFLGSLLRGGLSQAALVMYFKRAFPAIPLRVMLEAGGWRKVSDGGLTDDDFNSLLGSWLADDSEPGR